MYFSSMFSEAKSNVIDYFGEKIYNCYFYDLLGDYEFNIEFLSSKDDLQCIVFVFSYDFIGNIYLNGVKYDVPLGKYKSINAKDRELIIEKGGIDLLDKEIKRIYPDKNLQLLS